MVKEKINILSYLILPSLVQLVLRVGLLELYSKEYFIHGKGTTLSFCLINVYGTEGFL
jgi:hypothetical protein